MFNLVLFLLSVYLIFDIVVFFGRILFEIFKIFFLFLLCIFNVIEFWIKYISYNNVVIDLVNEDINVLEGKVVRGVFGGGGDE